MVDQAALTKQIDDACDEAVMKILCEEFPSDPVPLPQALFAKIRLAMNSAYKSGMRNGIEMTEAIYKKYLL